MTVTITMEQAHKIMTALWDADKALSHGNTHPDKSVRDEYGRLSEAIDILKELVKKESP